MIINGISEKSLLANFKLLRLRHSKFQISTAEGLKIDEPPARAKDRGPLWVIIDIALAFFWKYLFWSQKNRFPIPYNENHSEWYFWILTAGLNNKEALSSWRSAKNSKLFETLETPHWRSYIESTYKNSQKCLIIFSS